MSIIRFNEVKQKYEFYNTRNGYEDFGFIREQPEMCHNCHKPTMYTTTSTHFCPGCKALFTYWGNGFSPGNKAWNTHEYTHQRYQSQLRQEIYQNYDPYNDD